MISRPNTEDWKHWLAGGFAFMNAPFAVHPLDAERARKMYVLAMRSGVSLEDIKQAAREYLANRTTDPETIESQVALVEKFARSIKPTKKKKRAWLVTWDGTDANALPLAERVVAIFDARKSSEKVRIFIESHYIATQYSLAEKMHFSSKPKENPYPAEFVRTSQGIPFEGAITCGHNPFLYGRIVQNLRHFSGDGADEELLWDDVPLP